MQNYPILLIRRSDVLLQPDAQLLRTNAQNLFQS